ncbi:MAG: hypothetical protein MJE77_47050 [Proteobacteria bacterium]|nr:hypothetical protein [Pseudomonadota bacterium]
MAVEPARAQSNNELPADEVEDRKQRAEILYQEGIKLRRDALIAQALEKFEQALALNDHPYIRYNLALCLRSLGRPVDAFKQLNQALRSDKLTGEERQQGQQYAAELRKEIVELRVVCRDSDAKVSVNGTPLFSGPGQASRWVTPGTHQILAQKSIQLATAETVVIEAGPSRTVELFLPRLERRWDRRLPWAIAGGGALVALSGIPLQWLAHDNESKFHRELDAECGSANACKDGVPDSARTYERRSRRYNAAAVAGFAVGGAAIATGLALAIFNQPRVVKPDPATREIAISPLVGNDSAGIAAALSF